MRALKIISIAALSGVLLLFPLNSLAEVNDRQLAEESLFGPNADWIAQDHVSSRGIKDAKMNKKRWLVLDARLIGGHPNFASGEVYIDLRYFPGLEDKVQGSQHRDQNLPHIDLSRSTITVTAKAPAGLVGPEPRNGIQVFVKDENFKAQYGRWHNITKRGKQKVSLSPSIENDPGVFTEEGFDPTRVRIIGIKLGIGVGSPHSYEGSISITKINIDPPLPVSPPLALPSSAPPPAFRAGDKIEARSDGFYLNGRKWFLVGGNFRIIEYGQNFGTTAWFPSGNGVSKHPNFVRVSLDYFRRAGVKVIRVGLLDDGRTLFDENGHVAGYNDVFRRDVGTLLDLAQQSGLKVELTLFDFQIAGKGMVIDEVLVRGRSKVLTDEALRVEFRDRFLIPFLEEFAAHPALFGIDVINEPEWIVSHQDGGAWEDVGDLSVRADMPLPGSSLRSFIKETISLIRLYMSGKLITVGTSSKFIPLVRDSGLDYIALHHYPWMRALRDYIPLVPLNVPWSMEEFPTNTIAGDPVGFTPDDLTGWLNLALAEGGAGAMLWNLSPESDNHTFTFSQRESLLLEMRRWVDAHSSQIH